MTEFYKVVNGGIIEGCGTNGNDDATEITEDEYRALREMMHNCPTAPDGYAYALQDDPREWVLVEPPDEPDDDIDDAEAFEILFGGAV